MRLEELMIGNWVRDKEHKKICQVYSIGIWVDGNGEIMVSVKELDGTLKECKIDELEGVELTPEILEKNGWEAFHRWKNMKGILIDVYYQHFNKGIIDILFKDNSIEVYCEDVLDIFVTSIHQLQNALRLIGIDKEIVI